MNILETLREKFEDGAGAMVLFGFTIGVLAILALASYWVFSVTGFEVYTATVHHDAAVASFDWWFARMQIALLFIIGCVGIAGMLSLAALVCYGGSLVVGLITVKFLRKKA